MVSLWALLLLRDDLIFARSGLDLSIHLEISLQTTVGRNKPDW
jgi:hypothetical protein